MNSVLSDSKAVLKPDSDGGVFSVCGKDGTPFSYTTSHVYRPETSLVAESKDGPRKKMQCRHEQIQGLHCSLLTQTLLLTVFSI